MGYRVLTRVHRMALWGTVCSPVCTAWLSGVLRRGPASPAGCHVEASKRPGKTEGLQHVGAMAPEPGPAVWGRPALRAALGQAGGPWSSLGWWGSARPGTLARGPSQQEPCS